MGFLQNNILTNVFIIIEQDDKFCFVYVYKMADGKLKKKEKRKFFYEKENKTPSSMIDYIYSFSKKYSCTYIATLLDSSFQQITLERDIDRKFAKVLEEDNASILVNQDWRVYANLQEINKIKNDFSLLSLDYIFSPYAMLYYLYQNYSKGDNSLYILALSSSITIVIFKKNLAIACTNNSRISYNNEQDGEYDIEELDGLEDEFDMQADVEEIEIDLDLSYDDESEKEIIEEDTQKPADDLESELTEDIQSTIHKFYESKYYKGDEDLISDIIIFNDGIIDSKLQKQLKKSTMFDILTKTIKFSDTSYEMIKKSIREKS